MKACLWGFGVVGLVCGASLAGGTSDSSPAERLVADALRAEVAGDAARRAMLLDQAVAVAPENRLARWHRGELESAGQWRPIEQLQQTAAADPLRAEYLRLRESADDSFDRQLALARWCRKNKLDDEAWFHWANVVSREPGNGEALRALGMRWYQNRLLTFDQIDQLKERARAARRAAKRWAPQVTKWQRAIAADFSAREEALAEIRALTDRDAIAALEQVTLAADVSTDLERVRCRQLSRALIHALCAMPAQAATESLVRHALFSPVADVCDAAITGLSERPLHDYVPLLLDALAMPIESSFRVATDNDGSVHYWHSLYRQGRHADRSVESRFSAMQHDLQGPTHLTIINGTQRVETRIPAATNPAVTAEMARVATINQRQFNTKATAIEHQLQAINEEIVQSNARIIPLLAATTAQDFGDNPRPWWDWWDQHNEYYSEGGPPEYVERYAAQTHRYYRPGREVVYDITPPSPGRYSCFAEGTFVWTNTGRRAIETLQIGDLVLAQDVDTGELAYKPIVGRTVRPPTQILKLMLDDDEGEALQTTLGHPLWVAGTGWRMAKELEGGAILHGARGPVRVESIEPAGDAEAYNLIVADFSTYFVGERGILAHDNTPRQPTTATVPGLAAK